MSALLKYIFAALLVISTLCFTQEESHRQVIYQLTDSVIQKITADNIHLPAVVSLMMNDSLQNNFVKQQIIQSLVKNKMEVFLNGQSVDTIWEYNVREMSMTYSEVFSETFFGSRKVERNITLSIDVTIRVAPSGAVLFSKNFSEAHIDTIGYSVVPQLNDPSIPFTRLIHPELSFFDSILEPAIVIVASGVIIYLFFTIRS
jgi:hypothetical protein